VTPTHRVCCTAQACRLPYGLIVDGELRDLHDVRYLLSPQDLAALDLVPALLAAGVRWGHPAALYCAVPGSFREVLCCSRAESDARSGST
jgi:hypothetical protein